LRAGFIGVCALIGCTGTASDVPDKVTPPNCQTGEFPARLVVELDQVEGPFEERRFRMRPLQVQASAPVALTLAGSSIEIWGGETQLASPATVAPTDGAVTLHLRGRSLGESTLTLTEATCPPVEVTVDVVQAPGLAGRSLISYPWFTPADAFNPDGSVEAALDPSRYSDRIEATADVYVVAHRTPSEWAEDATLEDAGDGAETTTITEGSIADNTLGIWLSDLTRPTSTVSRGYDVVYDFGQDGILDPGDLIDGFDKPAFSVLTNLAQPGPYTPTSFDHQVSQWVGMNIYAPEELATIGSAPLVVISHGNGHVFHWYDWLGEHLASWGYVVMSHKNNTEPGPGAAAATTISNTDAFWRDLSSLGHDLDGNLDGRMVWIGHSRGGEGILIAYDDVVSGAANPQHFDADQVALLSSIAPTVFNGPSKLAPGNTSYHLLAGSADGDVTGGLAVGPIVQYFRFLTHASGTQVVTYIQGATHNDFNCCGTNDGLWVSGPKIGKAKSQATARAYYLALLEAELFGNDATSELLTHLPEGFRPTAAKAVLSNQYKDSAADNSFVVDDYQKRPNTDVSSSGGSVTWTGGLLVEGVFQDTNNNLTAGSDPMNGMTQANNDGDSAARGAVLEWEQGSSAQLELELVGHTDLTNDAWLSFRACQSTRDPLNVALDDHMSFGVALVDGNDVSSVIDFGVYGRISKPYKRDNAGWVNEFNTVRIRLADFETDGSGIDLANIKALRFDFGSVGSEQGRIGLDDIAIVARETL
jgi:hypothetical protein